MELNELKALAQEVQRVTKPGFGAKPISESQIKEAQSKAKSAAEAAKILGVSYNTYKKHAKIHGIFEDLKNPSGVGINKSFALRRTKNMSDEEWQNRLLINDLRRRKLHKYHTKDGSVKYGCALYFITIPKGESRKNFIKKWESLPIKIGISKDVIERYNTLVMKQKYVDSNEEKWIEWLEKAEVVNFIPFYTFDECVAVESRIHKYIRDYKIKGLKTKAGNEVKELFEADFEKVNEAIQTYVTGWRVLKWNSDEMNNDYGNCLSVPYSITSYQYKRV